MKKERARSEKGMVVEKYMKSYACRKLRGRRGVGRVGGVCTWHKQRQLGRANQKLWSKEAGTSHGLPEGLVFEFQQAQRMPPPENKHVPACLVTSHALPGEVVRSSPNGKKTYRWILILPKPACHFTVMYSCSGIK